MMNAITFNSEETKINNERALKGWNLYTRKTCTVCGAISPFRTEDELAVMGWAVYEDIESVKCSAHSKPAIN